MLTAFQNNVRLTSGPAWDVAIAVKAAMTLDRNDQFLCFDDRNGAFVDLDLSGTNEDVIARLKPESTKPVQIKHPKAGRPKLGVISKEVTLLPRHWEWLSQQKGGASATLRRLVEIARKLNSNEEKIRQAKIATDRFMIAMLGDQIGYESAARALYRGDEIGFRDLTRDWPIDLRAYVFRLAETAFTLPAESSNKDASQS